MACGREPRWCGAAGSRRGCRQSGFGFGGTVHLFEWLPLRVDHIYTSADFAVREAAVLTAGCSDHLPVVADLVLREEEQG